LHDRGIQRLTSVHAHRLIKFGAGLHPIDHSMRATDPRNRRIKLKTRSSVF
jgi:hypothetical protein